MPHLCTGCGHAFEDGSKEMLSGCPECGGNKFQFRPEGAELPDEPPGDAPDAPESPDRDGRTAVADSGSVAETVGRATTKMRDFVSANPDPDGSGATTPPDPDRSWPSETDDASDAPGDPSADSDPSRDADGEIIDADDRRDDAEGNSEEDVAQASARTDVVTNEELDDADPPDRSDPTGGDLSTGDAPPGPGPDVDGDGEVVGEPSDDDPDLSELRDQLNDQFESIKIVEPGQYELNLMELYDREEYIIALQENGRYVIQVPDQWIGDDVDDR